MTNGADVGGLLQQAGFALPTVDTLKVEVGYSSAFECMRHLGAIGESNASMLRQPHGCARDTLLATAAIYQEMFGDGEEGMVPATFEVIFAIAWKPDASQPAPKARGSAETSMKTLGEGATLR